MEWGLDRMKGKKTGRGPENTSFLVLGSLAAGKWTVLFHQTLSFWMDWTQTVTQNKFFFPWVASWRNCGRRWENKSCSVLCLPTNRILLYKHVSQRPSVLINTPARCQLHSSKEALEMTKLKRETMLFLTSLFPFNSILMKCPKIV